MGDRLPELVKKWYLQSYSKDDVWWAELALNEFAYLEALDYRRTGSPLGGVDIELNVHTIGYVGPKAMVLIFYDPEGPSIGADLYDYAQEGLRTLDELIVERYPDEPMPARPTPLDRAAIEDNVRWWAAGLRSIAPDVL
jgi:hypothetical protein